jgi:hypothetical protein
MEQKTQVFCQNDFQEFHLRSETEKQVRGEEEDGDFKKTRVGMVQQRRLRINYKE